VSEPHGLFAIRLAEDIRHIAQHGARFERALVRLTQGLAELGKRPGYERLEQDLKAVLEPEPKPADERA
jgi:hypothetical protein